MANFMIGCFILGAASVGLIHGQWGSLVGIVAVILWFSGLVRTGPNILQQFLMVGAISATAFYAYQQFAEDVSQTVVIVLSVILAGTVAASAVIWVRSLVRSRREASMNGRGTDSAVASRRRPVVWWAEVLAFLLFVGVPFAIGAAAAQASFNDEQESSDAGR